MLVTKASVDNWLPASKEIATQGHRQQRTMASIQEELAEGTERIINQLDDVTP